MRYPLTIPTLTLACFLTASAALAQGWLSDPVKAQAPPVQSQKESSSAFDKSSSRFGGSSQAPVSRFDKQSTTFNNNNSRFTPPTKAQPEAKGSAAAGGSSYYGSSLGATPTSAQATPGATAPGDAPSGAVADELLELRMGLVNERREQAEAKRIKTELIEKLTADSDLARLLAESELNAEEIEQILEKYDFRANMRAEELRLERLYQQTAQAVDESAWFGAAMELANYPLSGVQMAKDAVTGYIENNSGGTHGRFMMTVKIITKDNVSKVVKSEYVNAFHPGERRRIRFPYRGEDVHKIVVVECSGYVRPGSTGR